MPSFTKLLSGAISSLSDRHLGSLPAYTYSPLPHPRCIRLLEIHPDPGGILLNCTLHICDLDSHQPFDTLSYTWGNPLPPIHQTPGPSLWTILRPIICDGRVIKITTNLNTALRKLRDYACRPGRLAANRLIWIDAICINQADTVERSAQVSIMEDIYSRATRVIAWLGMSDRQTGPAMRCITYLAQFPETEYDKSNAWTLQQKGVPLSDARALVGFFMRKWFNRAWVVQEVVLASQITLLCGDHQLDWEVLARCSRFLFSCISPRDLVTHVPEFLSREQLRSKRMIKRPGYDIWGLDNLRAQLEEDDKDLGTLISWAHMGRIRDATDPRDRFFAMLGLLKKQARIRNSETIKARIPSADYSMTVVEVFASAASLVLEFSDKIPLFLLSMIEDRSMRSPELVDKLPSWVPDLTVPINPEPLIRLSPSSADRENEDVKLWNPCDDYNDNVANPIPIDGRFLCIQGAAFDHVMKVSVPLESENVPFSWANTLDAFRSQWAGVVSGTSFMDALWRTLVADMETPGASMPANAQFGWGFVEMLLRKAVGGRAPHDSERLIHLLTEASSASGARTPIAPEKMQQCLALLRGPPSPQRVAIDTRIEAYQKIMASVCGSRRLFLTRGNYLGVGAQSTEVGDQVWIFPGANVPFVLGLGASGRFRLIGEAYVHGIMYGEAAPALVGRYQDIELE